MNSVLFIVCMLLLSPFVVVGFVVRLAMGAYLYGDLAAKEWAGSL